MAVNVNLWKAVQIALQSAVASPVTITAISQANPAVITATNTYSAGDFVVLSIQGMTQMDGRVVRVLSPSGSAFSAEGVDSTLFDAFTSGTASKLTFGTTIDSAVSMQGTGGDFAFIDTTTIHASAKSQVPGLANPITYTFDNLWDPADAGQIALKAASDATQKLAIKISFPGGAKTVFSGYIGFAAAPGGNAQDKVTSSCVITAFSKLTNYST